MNFWDIGAHAGEFSTIAAGCVAPGGSVRAFEPHPLMFDLLSQNLNQASCRVHVARKAVSDAEGSVEMVVSRCASRLRAAGQEITQEWVPSVSLDSVWALTSTVPDLIRVSVGGAEPLVLAGAGGLLDLPVEEAPVWIVAHHPRKLARFDLSARYVLAEFGCCGYAVSWLTPQGLIPATLRNLPQALGRNLVAFKRESGSRE